MKTGYFPNATDASRIGPYDVQWENMLSMRLIKGERQASHRRFTQFPKYLNEWPSLCFVTDKEGCVTHRHQNVDMSLPILGVP